MEKILRQYGVTTHIEVVPNGADLTPFLSATPLARAEFGYDEDDILLVYMGRIAPEKNLEFLLRSFAGGPRAIPKTKMLVVGGGQKEHEESVKSVADELALGDRIYFTGSVPYDKIPSYLSMCDIFTTASVTEVHPFSVIEGMAAGLAVVGIDSPGISDSITDGITGILSTEDIATYTARLTLLCSNRDLQRKMGAAAQKASDQFSIEHTTKIMLGHYTRLAMLFSIYALMTLLMRPIVGPAMDRFGRLRFFLAGLTLQILSNLFVAIGSSYDWLFWGRLIQGVSAGLLWLSAYAITADLAARRRAGNLFGSVEEILARGGLYGAIIGAPALPITNFAAWAWTTMFLIYAALCAVGLWIAFRNVPETWEKAQQAPAALTSVIQRTKIQQFISAVPQQLWLLAAIVVFTSNQAGLDHGPDRGGDLRRGFFQSVAPEEKTRFRRRYSLDRSKDRWIEEMDSNGRFWPLTALFLFFLGKSNYHQRFPAEFVLIVLGTMAVLIFAFYFLSNKEKS